MDVWISSTATSRSLPREKIFNADPEKFVESSQRTYRDAALEENTENASQKRMDLTRSIIDDITDEVSDFTRNVTLTGYDCFGAEQRNTSHPFEALARSVIPERYFSREHLKHNFIEFKKAQGWIVVEGGAV